MASLPDSRTESVRDRIYRVALQHFEEDGFRGATMMDIAKDSGLTKAGLYHYFATKAELLEFVYEKVSEQLQQTVAAMSQPDLPPESRLEALIYAQVRHHVANSSFLSVFWRERHELDSDARNRVRAYERRYEAAVRQLLLDGQEHGTFRISDAELTMSMILGVLSTVYRWAHHVDRDADNIASALTSFVLNGIVARPLDRTPAGA